MNEINKTELEKERWYRLLKVVYIIAYVLFEIFILAGFVLVLSSIGDGESGMWEIIFVLLLGGILGIPLFFYLIKHIFFYVLEGKWDIK